MNGENADRGSIDKYVKSWEDEKQSLKAPCRDCKERHIACHGICEKYKKWREWRDAIMEAKAAETDLDNAAGGVKLNGMKRHGKKIYER